MGQVPITSNGLNGGGSGRSNTKEGYKMMPRQKLGNIDADARSEEGDSAVRRTTNSVSEAKMVLEA